MRAGALSKNKKNGLAALGILILPWTSAFGQAAEEGPGQVRIVPGQELVTPLRGDESVAYQLELAGGGAYYAEVMQNGVDLVATLQHPDGATETYDSPLPGDEREVVFIESAQSGSYLLVVQRSEPGQSAADHTIRLTRLDPQDDRAAAEREALLLMREGELAYAAALALDSSADEEADDDEILAGYETAVRHYESAAELWQGIGRSRDAAHARYSAATIMYGHIGDWHGAATAAAGAAALYVTDGQRHLQANTLLLEVKALAEALHQEEDKDALLERIAGLAEVCVDIFEELGDSRGRNEVRYFEALSAFNAGRYDEARTKYAKTRSLFMLDNDWKGERRVLRDLAVIEFDLGNSTEAIEQFKSLLAENDSRIDNPNSADEMGFRAQVLDTLGIASVSVGDIDEALENLSRARELHEKSDDRHGLAESLLRIATLYVDSGDFAQAKTNLDLARRAAEASKNNRVSELVHIALGNLAYFQGDHQSARESYERALSATPDGSPLRGYREFLLARAYIALEEFGEAAASANEALRIAEDTEALLIRAEALLALGIADRGLQDTLQSIEALEQASDIYERLALDSGQAEVKHELALSLARLASGADDQASQLARLDEAIERSAESLVLIEGLIRKVKAPEMRAYYAAMHRGYYESHIGTLMERHKAAGSLGDRFMAEALATSERARARMTMDLLNEASVDLRQRIDPETANEMSELLEQLIAIAAEQDAILDAGGADLPSDSELRSLSERSSRIKSRIDVLQSELRRNDAHYAALTAPATVSLSEVRELIGDDSVLLQYFLGQENSFAWIVAGDSVRTIELADAATIENATQELLASLTALPRNRPEGAASLDQALLSVSRLVLQPLASFIGDKRLIVVADGALNYVPFQILPLTQEGSTRRVLETREVVALPSMSVLAALREREASNAPGKWLAVFADPVFNADDSRVSGEAAAAPPARSVSTPAYDSFTTRSSLSRELVRLPHTRREANDIAKLIPDDDPADNDPLIAVDFEASRRNVLELPLGEYRYVHFATHGEIDSEIPELSALVLSRVDEQGRRQDGYLRLHDIYNLELNADLVVLSACETGLGTDIRGEGLIGLTQGFLYAGAQSLLVSLWKVPERATADLMIEFYSRLINDRLSPSAALREAQRMMASSRRWSDPFYWGAFTLVGDWKEPDSTRVE